MKLREAKWMMAIFTMALFFMVGTGTVYATTTPTMKKTLTLQKGKSYNLNISGLTKQDKVTWKSSKPSVATVDKRGVVTGVKQGKGNIVVSINNETKLTCEVSITRPKYIASFLGDSITYGLKSKKRYDQYLTELLKLEKDNNYGISGTDIAHTPDRGNAMVDRYKEIANDSNLIFVFGGTNDWGHNVPLGIYGSKDTSTFYGAVNVLMKGLKKQYPDAQIVFATPIKRLSLAGKYVGYKAKNAVGNRVSDYAGAIKRTAREHNIPVIDLYNASACDFTADTDYKTYWEDGLHPNAAGQKRIADHIYNKIKSMLE